MDQPRRLIELRRAILEVAAYPPDPTVIALSGGADSATLAALAPNPVKAIHVHHGQPHSNRAETAARDIARRLDIPVEVHRVRPEVKGFEDSARQARYRVFETVVGEGEWLATGHTLDDLAETVLMRLARGSGLDGLTGIPQLRPPYVRPLLKVNRSQTREYATLAGLAWVDDPTNQETDGLRNRVRHRLLPALRETFGEDPSHALAISALELQEERAFLDRLVEQVAVEVTEDAVRVRSSDLAALDPVPARRLIRSMWHRLGFVYPPDRAAIARVIEVAAGRARSTQVGRGVTAILKEEFVELRRPVSSSRAE